MVTHYDIGKTKLNLPLMWEEVLETNQTINKQYKLNSAADIKAEILNNNKNILIDNQTFFIKHIFTHNIDKVSDWFNWNGTIKNYDQLKQSDASLKWIEYRQIVSAIPINWKISIRNRDNRLLTITQPEYNKKIIGEIMARKRTELPTAQAKWNNKIDNRFNARIDWPRQYALMRIVTKDANLRMTQYYILNNAIMTKSKLKMRKIIADATCNFCNTQEQNLELVLFDCEVTKKLFSDIYKNNHTLLQKQPYLITKNIVNYYNYCLLDHQDSHIYKTLNLLLLWLKQYLITSIRNDEILIKVSYEQYMANRLKYERTIAKREGKLNNLRKTGKM